MKTTWATQLRALATTLSDNGKKPISTLMLCAALSADDVETKARVRKSVSEMVKRGEFVRIRDGEFNYIPQKAAAIGAYGESYRRMWRIIRTEKAGWTVQTIASTTRLHSATVSHYCQYLEREEYIARCGKQGKGTILDPFIGGGTTALAALDTGRKCVGIELSEEYAALAVERIRQHSQAD